MIQIFLFSACPTPNVRIFEILFNASSSVELISSHVLVEDLNFHKTKLIRLSKLTNEEIEAIIELTLRQIEISISKLLKKHIGMKLTV